MWVAASRKGNFRLAKKWDQETTAKILEKDMFVALWIHLLKQIFIVLSCLCRGKLYSLQEEIIYSKCLQLKQTFFFYIKIVYNSFNFQHTVPFHFFKITVSLEFVISMLL